MPGAKAPVLAPMIDKLAKQSPLGPADIDALLALPYRLGSAAPGSYIVREGDKAEYCVLLLSGFVYRCKVTGDGARQIFSIHLRGDLVDLQNSLLEQADHSVQAMTSVDIAYIPIRAILDVAQAHPAIAIALWRDTLLDAAIFREWILNVGQRNSRQRISHLMCELALRQEAAGLVKGPDYVWPITQEQLGDATGLTAVHVNRTLQSMRSDGLIGSDKRTLRIVDWRRLQVEGDFSPAYLHQAVSQAA